MPRRAASVGLWAVMVSWRDPCEVEASPEAPRRASIVIVWVALAMLSPWQLVDIGVAVILGARWRRTPLAVRLGQFGVAWLIAHSIVLIATAAIPGSIEGGWFEVSVPYLFATGRVVVGMWIIEPFDRGGKVQECATPQVTARARDSKAAAVD